MEARKHRRLCMIIESNQETLDRLKDLLEDHVEDIDNVPPQFNFTKSKAKMEKGGVLMQTAFEYIHEVDRILNIVKEEG